MKKLQFAVLLTLTGLGVLAQSAQGATTTYNTGDLFLGFSQTGNSASDILIDLGPLNNFRDNYPLGSLNSIIGTGLGTLLNSTFEASSGIQWYNDTTVHWGIAGSNGASTTSGGSLTDNPNTLYISNPETNTTSIPTSNTNSVQNGVTNKIGAMGTAFKGQTTSGGLLNGLVESPTLWANGTNAGGNFADNTQFSHFQDTASLSSSLDLLRISRISPATGDGFRGTFTIDNTGQVFYGTVPEPTTAVTLLGGAGMLLLARRRRQVVA